MQHTIRRKCLKRVSKFFPQSDDCVRVCRRSLSESVIRYGRCLLSGRVSSSRLFWKPDVEISLKLIPLFFLQSGMPTVVSGVSSVLGLRNDSGQFQRFGTLKSKFFVHSFRFLKLFEFCPFLTFFFFLTRTLCRAA